MTKGEFYKFDGAIQSLFFVKMLANFCCCYSASHLAGLVKQRQEQRVQRAQFAQQTAEQTEELSKRRAVFDKLGLTGDEKIAQELAAKELKHTSQHYRRFVKASLRSRGIKHDDADFDGIGSDDISQPLDISKLFGHWSIKHR